MMSVVTWAEVKYGNVIEALDGSRWSVSSLTYWKWQGPLRVPCQDQAFASGVTVGLRNASGEVVNMNVDNLSEQVIRVAFDPNLLARPMPSTPPMSATVEDVDLPDTEPAPIYAPSDDMKRNSDVDPDVVEMLSEPIEAEGGLGAEVIADEDNATIKGTEEATVFEPFEIPEIHEMPALLSHLYLIHGLSLTAEAIPEEALYSLNMLTRLHQQAHKDGPLPNIHTHTKEA